MTRALASIGAAGSVRTMAHPTFATETVVDPVTGGRSPEGWGGLEIGDPGTCCLDSGTQI